MAYPRRGLRVAAMVFAVSVSMALAACAGTIGAIGNNAMGVPGVNWNVKIMGLKLIGPDGGSSSDAILVLQYAQAKGAKVINCSWGGGASWGKRVQDNVHRC